MTREPTPTDSLSRVRDRAGVRARALRTRPLGGDKFRRQHAIDRYIADFACVEAGLVVELDGGQHFEAQARRADERRTAVLRDAGFEVLRFTNREALSERDAILARILDWLLQTHHPHPLPPAGEGVSSSKDRT